MQIKNNKLYIFPTRYACNMKCSYCITKTEFPEKSSFPEFLTFENFLKSFNKIDENMDEIEITGGGEPTLNVDFYDIIKHISAYKNNRKIKLYTNASERSFIELKKLSREDLDEITLTRAHFDDNLDKNIKLGNTRIKDKFYETLDYCSKTFENVRVRYLFNEDEYSNSDIENLINFLNSLNATEIIIASYFNKPFKNPLKTYLIFSAYIQHPIKIDNNDTICPESNILYTDGNIYKKWKDISEFNKPGYHISNICKGELGYSSKILEEVNELIDAENQNNKIMSMLELSDIYGALNECAKSYNITMEDLKIMSECTSRAFKNNKRT